MSSITPIQINSQAILINSYSHANFHRNILEMGNTSFGPIGQQLNGTPVRIFYLAPEQQQAPTAFDVLIDPRTGAPTTTRIYNPRPLTDLEIEYNVDPYLAPLLTSDAQRLQLDIREWRRTSEKFFEEISAFQVQDAACLRYILAHISQAALQDTKANPAYIPWTKLLATAPLCISRSFQLLELLRIQYSQINSSQTINRLQQFINLRQLPNQAVTEFFHLAQEAFQDITPHLESKEHPGFTKLDRIFALVVLSGTDKTSYPTKRATEIHLQNHRGATALDFSQEYCTEVMAAHTSDLTDTNDPPSQQSAAYVAKPSPPKPSPPSPTKRAPGVQITGRTDHCTNCYNLIRLYFYHPTKECTRTRDQPPRNQTKKPPSAGLLSAPPNLPVLTADDHLTALMAWPKATPSPSTPPYWSPPPES